MIIFAFVNYWVYDFRYSKSFIYYRFLSYHGEEMSLKT